MGQPIMWGQALGVLQWDQDNLSLPKGNGCALGTLLLPRKKPICWSVPKKASGRRMGHESPPYRGLRSLRV